MLDIGFGYSMPVSIYAQKKDSGDANGTLINIDETDSHGSGVNVLSVLIHSICVTWVE